MENFIYGILHHVIFAIELIGIGIIIYGTIKALIKHFIDSYKAFKNKKSRGASVKLVLANYLALGLEFMLAAEILRTVTTNREFSEIIILGAIIILRAAMSLLIYWELSYEEKKENLIEKKKEKNIKTL